MVLDTRIIRYGFIHMCTCVGTEGRLNRFVLVKKNHCNFKIPAICKMVWSKSLSTSLSSLSIGMLPSQSGASNSFFFFFYRLT